MMIKYLKVAPNTDDSLTLAIQDRWTIEHTHAIEQVLKRSSLLPFKKIILDGKALEEIDTSGAWLLISFIRTFKNKNIDVLQTGFQTSHSKIFNIIKKIEHPDSIPEKTRGPFVEFFKYVGKSTFSIFEVFSDLIVFFGQICTTAGNTILAPTRLRLRSLVYHMNEIGIKAVPIVSLMAFLISIVLGYQGALQLKRFGATIFTIDLVAISVLREMGPLITAIMVAGRSGSAFAAQIGVMKMNKEVDAMRTIGLDPFELLILPRVISILIVLPILTFIADVVGLLGTLFVSLTLLDVSTLQFLQRLQSAVNLNTFWVGLVKTPIFGLIISMVGSLQGMKVGGSAVEVGTRTTTAVVQSIFLVIMADAIFSILFAKFDI